MARLRTWRGALPLLLHLLLALALFRCALALDDDPDDDSGSIALSKADIEELGFKDDPLRRQARAKPGRDTLSDTLKSQSLTDKEPAELKHTQRETVRDVPDTADFHGSDDKRPVDAASPPGMVTPPRAERDVPRPDQPNEHDAARRRAEAAEGKVAAAQKEARESKREAEERKKEASARAHFYPPGARSRAPRCKCTNIRQPRRNTCPALQPPPRFQRPSLPKLPCISDLNESPHHRAPSAMFSSASPAAAFERLQEQYPPQYLDVRTPPEFQAGHPPGAVNVPVTLDFTKPVDTFVQNVADLFPKDADLLVGCKTGARSMMAIGLLEKAGFEKLTNVEGGYNAWNAASLPLGN
ncbi:unnamed protein product [Chondrus crispus]|uniref:Rhodanese domain-containing protein n=1 Tax=Chondrus crispus TaxID=2769 RepID=R7QPY2_CHOCR|nr:unnamed protein product [Chondrus crispus]CDF40174.1 unnamed protein product [Chondrus crispus]|eukprot:XP_005710468.1 unnamed protein product [Chondrus crispus]